MKKLSALLCVILTAVLLSACQAFYNDTSKNYTQDEPMTTTVFLQLKALPAGSTIDAELTAWLGEVRTAAENADEDSTHILTADLTETNNDGTYTIKLTLTHVPDNVLVRTVRPFKIYLKHLVYNPIQLLPESDVFTYIVGYTSERRHSSANTDWVTTDSESSDYIYLWTTNDTIEFTDIYPNRPLYLLIVLASAVVIGGLVFLVSRYYDCKKHKNHL